MRCFRLSSVSLASCLAASLIACGGGDDGDGGTTPTGEHYKFVVDGANVPSSNTEVNMYGLDLDELSAVRSAQARSHQDGVGLAGSAA